MKSCNYCGCQNEDSTKFCINCGAQFPEPVQVQTPAPEPYNQTSYSQPAQTWNQPQPGPAPEPQTLSALAVTGFILSLLSILCCGFTAVFGLIFSIAGLIAASKKNKKGIGFAVTGLIVSGFLTLFLLLCIAVSWGPIQTAYREVGDGDVEEFLEVFERELDEMEQQGSSSRRSSSRSGRSNRDNRNTDDDDDGDDDDDTQSFSSDWVDCEVSADMTTIEIIYTDGIPDDFEFCGADFDEICDVLEDNLTFEDNFGQTASFDREEFRRLLSMVLISSDEYDRMHLSRSQVLDMLSYLAALSYEMDHDGFEPDRAVYTEATDVYDFYGIIEPNNIGHAVVVFTDGTDSYYFEEAMCGDEICWSVVPGTYDVFRIGMTADSLNEYPAGGFAEFASWVSSILDPVI